VDPVTRTTDRKHDATGLYSYRARYYSRGLDDCITEDTVRGRLGPWIGTSTRQTIPFDSPIHDARGALTSIADSIPQT
jgi:hypothetical protein